VEFTQPLWMAPTALRCGGVIHNSPRASDLASRPGAVRLRSDTSRLWTQAWALSSGALLARETSILGLIDACWRRCPNAPRAESASSASIDIQLNVIGGQGKLNEQDISKAEY